MKLPFTNNRAAVIGIMSGTSLDGLDIVACNFFFDSVRWNFEIIKSATYKYSPDWEDQLKNAPELSAINLLQLNKKYGQFIGKKVNEFIKKLPIKIDLIASHGHTVFHQPEIGITYQIGDGNRIGNSTGIPTVSDFRSNDVALGGQGAPLVPIGDKLLFSNYDYCLNLGGFSNISFEKNGKRLAFDICPVNIILNYLSEKMGEKFDKDGFLGRQGKVDKELLSNLNNLPYYSEKPPKSLGREWVEKQFLPILKSCNSNISDIFRTVYEHIAIQIGTILNPPGKVLITGGGAFNTFLIERIKNFTDSELIIPKPEIVNFKEALIFAFLGLLKVRGEINCLASVTGASADSCSGTINFPNG